MFKKVVTYHIHRQKTLPPNDAVAYQYVLAAGGLYLRAENAFFDVCLPLARCRVRGLASLKPRFVLKVPRLPGRLLEAVLADARQARRPDNVLDERLYHFYHDGGWVRVVKPPQRTTAASVVAAEADPAGLLLDLHSHGNMGAFWSGTDNGDEQGFRAYGVIGRLDERPEIRLRLGVYGVWFPLPATALFAGTGSFVDIYNRRRKGRTTDAAPRP